ncbi:protein phosphatase 1 regulatory subunit 36-like isoform X2 [Dendronephthya gigantea]|uniref:protein phosphatase 1 regulatory subunit 36-like isoform X2 n=1 Tax=Dendronephthya gigantea TaxID=151771 RepID=UPI00106968FC|nr:protein phosphatase 1 regulatory subunit 36-like isoform X2 [Dendronephthya gigantea]
MAKTTQDPDPLEAVPLQLNEQWIWKDDTNSLELISNISGLSSTNQSKKSIKPTTGYAHEKRNDRITSNCMTKKYGMKLQAVPPSTAMRVSSAKPSIRSGLPTAITSEHNTITINDIKTVAKNNCLNDRTKDSPLFKKNYFNSAQLDDFLWAALNYFDAFFERKLLEEKPKPMAVQPSLAEKKAIALVLNKEEEAKRFFAQCYGVLVLGLGLKDAHHMHCGRKRNSATQRDRELYENLYNFVANVTWITFRHPNLDVIEKELGRLLRSDTFNPAIRPKHPEEYFGKDHLKQDHNLSPLTPAEYRRLQQKRPAIKSIVNQRSPVISAIIPTSTEAAKQCKTRQEMNSLITMEYKHTMEFPKRVGIIGEATSGFNAETLMPLGEDQDMSQVEIISDDCSMQEIKSR